MRLAIIFMSLVLCAELRAQEIGLQLYSLRGQFAQDVPGTMAKIKSFGIREIEAGNTYGLSFPEFIKLVAQNNLEVVSFGTDFERLEKFPQNVADDARMYGAKYVVCFWLPHTGDVFTKEDADRAAAVLNRAGAILAQNGLLLCYHPHGYEFRSYNTGTVFDYLVNALDTRFVYLQMDVFWVKQAGQDPLALLKRYANRWVLLHLKDRRKGTADTLDGHADDDTNVVLGQGDVDIAAIMKQAKEIGIKHYFIEDESSHAEEQIPLSLAYLKTLNEDHRSD
jgi:sugar phosphate isomerase/epimerase